MKGFILAAGLGSRLKPWTDFHPKALAPIGEKPMLQKVIEKLNAAGVTDITLNVHHFAEQIYDFVAEKGWKINFSDESECLLETGGALLKAYPFLKGNDPILVHNVDILSNANLELLLNHHISRKADATLLVSDRDSSRKLIFDSSNILIGWHNIKTNDYRPQGFKLSADCKELAFSGIYVISPKVIEYMNIAGWSGKYSIIDYFLSTMKDFKYEAYIQPDLEIIDIGKPDSYDRANKFMNK